MTLTRIDHVMICVPDLQAGIETYRRIGFDVHYGGVHPRAGTENAIAFFEDDYLELLSIRPGEQALAGAALTEFIGRGGGLRYLAIQSDDLPGDVAAMRRRGVDIGDPVDGGRRTPAGQELRWRVARLGAGNPLPIFFIEHLTAVAERRRQVPRPGEHPNGVVRPERAYIVVADVTKAAETYARVLGLPVPHAERGTVIKANMIVFNLGPTGLGVAEPFEPGPAAEALASRGPGPFQVLFRTRSMDAADRWIREHGIAPPARGIRNTGEHAMLVPPRDACGVFIGFTSKGA
jgi:catechol 2,3-dioxygenase-like lactoylglutathione lyase family enzyme